ncbi:MAG TPA: hypothetical protein VFR81_24115 [Longimicrobium sp.]|nr:hypothetical protein [Longimicrobium sp.]
MTTWIRIVKTAVVAGTVAAAAAGTTACGSADAQPSPEEKAAAAAAGAAPRVVTVTAHDYSFEAPAEVPAGPTTFRLVNAGEQIHHVQLVRLDEGKTMQDLFAAFEAGGPPPAWAHEVGGPNAPNPRGGESNATVTLEPGNYVLLCFVDLPGGVPHVMRGMAKALRVTAPTASAGERAADVTMTLDDYSFTLSKPLAAGKHTVRVENTAEQPHEVELVRFAPGKTLDDLGAWMANPQGPPPAELVGGVTAIAPGVTNTFDVELAAGQYALLCFVPDAGDGKPHLHHGMAQPFTVD